MTIAIVAVVLALYGCVTVTASRSVVVPPRDYKTVVTSNAVAHCQDFFFIMHCTLNVELQEAK